MQVASIPVAGNLLIARQCGRFASPAPDTEPWRGDGKYCSHSVKERRMKAVAALVSLLALASAVHAEDRLNSQQERMTRCNERAADRHLKGEDRSEFMASCLRGDSRPLSSQQQRMVSCNREAKADGLSGEKRRSFISRCLREDSRIARGRVPDANAGASSDRRSEDERIAKRTPQQNRMASCNSETGDKHLKGEKRRAFISDCLKG
jgi:hypothetical protein